MKKRLLFLAAFAAAPVLFAGCEGDTVGEPSPTSDDSVTPQCQKADDPLCQTAPLESDPTDTTEGSQPDTVAIPPDTESATPAVDYEGVYCPNMGCTFTKSKQFGPDEWDCGDPPDFPLDSMDTTGIKTEWITPELCDFPEPTNE